MDVYLEENWSEVTVSKNGINCIKRSGELWGRGRGVTRKSYLQKLHGHLPGGKLQRGDSEQEEN